MSITQLFASALSVFGIRTAEEPPDQVIDRLGDVEIRRYGARYAAETTVADDGNQAKNRGFFILAGYIFGGNRRKQAIDMTAPVAMEDRQKIGMTAPVATEGNVDGEVSPCASSCRLRSHPPTRPSRTTHASSWSRCQRRRWPRSVLPAAGARPRWPSADGTCSPRSTARRWSALGKPFTQLYDPPFTIPYAAP